MGRVAPLALLVVVVVVGCNCNEYGFLAARKTGDLSVSAPPRVRFDTRGRAACGDGPVTDAGRAALRRYPYLQQVTRSQAQLLWTAASPRPGAVRVWKGEQQVADAAATVDTSAPLKGATQFVARFDGLEPATTYCYELLGPDGTLWVGKTSLQTAPTPGDPGPIRIAAMGDAGSSGPDQFAVLEQLETVEMDLLLIAGDVAYDSGKLAEFERNVFGVYRELLRRVPLFPASGNHDYKTDDAKPFRQVFSLPENGGEAGRERWYSFDWGDVHVVVLDTEKIDDRQIAWAEADLAAAASRWTIVLSHRPPFSGGSHGDDREVQEAFLPMFVRHGVDLVLSGHDHHYERSRAIDGVVYVVTGGGGRGTRDVGQSDTAVFAERVAHFVYLQVEGDRLELHAIDARGNVFDSTRIDKAAAPAPASSASQR